MNALSIVGVSAVFSLLVLSVLCLCVEKGFHPLRGRVREFRRLPLFEKLLVLAFVGVLVAYASVKEPANSPPSGLMGPRMALMAPDAFEETGGLPTNGWREVSRSANAWPASAFARPADGQVWEQARSRGARRGYWRLPFGGWSFPGSDFGWTNGFLWAEGQFRPKVESTRDGVVLFDRHLALAPFANWERYGLDASLCWSRTNAVGGIVGTVVGAAVDDDPAKAVSAQIELFPADGRLVLRYDLSRAGEGPFRVGPFENGVDYRTAISSNVGEVVFQRVHPDDWDMDGLPNGMDEDPRIANANAGWNQSTEWAIRAFPSHAAEIAAEGYSAFAASRGSQSNRHLVGLHVDSPTGAWPVCLTFGGRQVMCDGREEVVFAIDDGARYPFSLSAGELAVVTLHASNSIDESCFAYGYPYEFRAGDVVVHLDSPRSGWMGRLPEVQVDTSGLTHFFPDDTRYVSAVLTNCHEDAYIGCEWHGGGGIAFSDGHSLSTAVTWNGDVAWATNSVALVTMYEGDYAVTNTMLFSVGSQAEPDTELAVGCQKIFFLNDADFLSAGGCPSNRPERIRPVVLNLRAARGVGGYVAISSEGDAAAVLCKVDENGVTNLIDSTTRIPLNISNDSLSRESRYEILASCPKLGRGSISARFFQEGATSSCASHGYQVIEPIRRLVMNKTAGVFGYRSMLNPACLVYGTNAVLGVGVNVAAGDPFPMTNVQWIVKGPGNRVATLVREDMGESAVVVEATEPAGTVEVVAKFNDDEIQPTFVLPIIQQRVIPMRVFCVEPSEGEEDEQWLKEEIIGHVQYANMILGQVGIQCELEGEISTVPNSRSKWEIAMTGNQAGDLFRHYAGHDCVEVYYLGRIKNDLIRDTAAFHGTGGIVISKTACQVTLAHELGHALGLQDCYVAASRGHGLLMANWNSVVTSALFPSKHRDWGLESGCGFYERADSVSNTICRLLMSGIPYAALGFGCDIPAGRVVGMGGEAESAEDARPVKVGAQDIEPDDRKVFSK